jgi:DNA-directed RNA polymerase specialized sigma24 family protein
MPPTDRVGQQLRWSSVYPTGNAASDEKLEAAGQASWPYASLCAWTYLNDSSAAHDLMDHAIANTSRYLACHPERSAAKLTARVKSAIRRRAKQLATKNQHERSFGLLVDMEELLIAQPDAELRVLVNELLERLSPFASSIVKSRWHGYSWREIAKQFEMDHTAVRRAYFHEIESLLHCLSRPGDLHQCD